MLEDLLILLGEPRLLGLAGVATGVIFGWAAQRSRFCLRAATVEVADGQFGPRMAIWLIVFFTALAMTQAGVALGLFDVSETRQLAGVGSLSGAVIGGLMFGVGMILARGCASRLLVLSATGNLRALMTGLVVTLVAQSAYRGVLAPAREALSGLWTIGESTGRNLLTAVGIGPGIAATAAALALFSVLAMARRRDLSLGAIIAGVCVGGAVALGWGLTASIAAISFEIVPISSVTFTGPSTDTLMALVTQRNLPLSFGVGLVPGVFASSFVASFLRREFKIQRFGPDAPMENYLAGAVLMGFGAMLAGGCAVGAGVSGGAVLSMTAVLAVFFMWVGAVVTIRLSHRGANPTLA